MSMWGRKKKEYVDAAAVDRMRDYLRNERQQRFADDDSSELRAAHAASSAPEIQERALAQMEADAAPAFRGSSTDTAQVLTERVRTLQNTCRRLEETIGQLGAEVERISAAGNGISILTRRAGPHDPRRSVGSSRPSEQAAEPRQIAARELAFQPNERPVTIVVDGVPDFQALMEMQRALDSLLEAETATVAEYQDGQASFELELHTAATPAQVVAGLHRISGHSLLIEEAKPHESSMRLRFQEASVSLVPES